MRLMATLTLKKKPRLSRNILGTPASEMLGKYAVARQLSDVKSVRFTCYHDSLESAESEAERLSKTADHYRYFVLYIVGTRGA